jgi:hypothetical protein
MPWNRIYFDLAGVFGLSVAGGVCFGGAGAFFFSFLSPFTGLLFPPLPDCCGIEITSFLVSSSHTNLLHELESRFH